MLFGFPQGCDGEGTQTSRVHGEDEDQLGGELALGNAVLDGGSEDELEALLGGDA